MSDNGESDDDTAIDTHEPPQLIRLRALANPEIQKYIDTPPGEGMSVIYAAVNIKDGKVYVGKHCHGKSGTSFRRSRMQNHLHPNENSKHYFANAMRKYGQSSFVWFIIWHGSVECENKAEKYWISSEGLNTINAYGGWGYNVLEGGEGGAFSDELRHRLKQVHNSAESLERHRAAGKLQSDREEAADPGHRVRRGKDQYDREEEADPGHRKRRGKTQFEREEAENPGAWAKRLKDARSRPDVRAKQSRNAKAQQQQFKETGRDTIPQLAQKWKDNATDEQLNAKIAKQSSTWNDKRKKALAKATDDEKIRLLAQWKSTDKNSEVVRQKLAAMRKIPGFENSKRVDVTNMSKTHVFDLIQLVWIPKLSSFRV
jgi:hypothetical protein